MRLLLIQDVRKLGHLGDVVDVKAGYARNYLLPQRMATDPTEENIKAIESARIAATAARAQKMKEFAETAEKMKEASVMIEAAANEEGTLYGSVGPKEIAAALQAQGFPVLPEFIVLDHPIRQIDNRSVKVEFTDEITVMVKVWVVREGAPANAEQPSEREAGAESAKS